MQDPRCRDVVLLGIGHTNAHVVDRWRREPLPHARLTCVSDRATATYSGMLPGVLAGDYTPDAMEIDLRRLCESAGARLVVAHVAGVDAANRQLLFVDRPPISFDVLSIGIGSVPGTSGVEFIDRASLVAIKPMQTFLPRLDRRLHDAAAERGAAPVRLVTIGGGAAGIEVSLCLPFRLRATLGDDVRHELTIVSGSEHLLPGSSGSTARRAERICRHRGVRIVRGRRVTRVDRTQVGLEDGTGIDADVVLWATAAAAPTLLAAMGLPTDPRGFLLTADTLQSTSGAPVFAVGDSGSISGATTPKAGVYAVRQGPVLWENIERMLSGRPLRHFTPQRAFLRLLNVGEGRCVGEWRGLSFEGRWCRRLKDAIDRRFVESYQGVDRAIVDGRRTPPSP